MASDQLIPDLIGFNGNVITVDPYKPRAQAFAIREGVFVAVGDNEEIKDLAGPHTRKMDFAGSTVIPGFNDAHIHVLSSGIRHTLMARLRTPIDRRNPGGHPLPGIRHRCRRMGPGIQVRRHQDRREPVPQP